MPQKWLVSIIQATFVNMLCSNYFYFINAIAFSALTVLVGFQEEHPACKNSVMKYWCGYLSAARCKSLWPPYVVMLYSCDLLFIYYFLHSNLQSREEHHPAGPCQNVEM